MNAGSSTPGSPYVATTVPEQYRVWLLYMAASALNFETGRSAIHQVLGVKADGGDAGVPLTRSGWTDW